MHTNIIYNIPEDMSIFKKFIVDFNVIVINNENLPGILSNSNSIYC